MSMISVITFFGSILLSTGSINSVILGEYVALKSL